MNVTPEMSAEDYRALVNGKMPEDRWRRIVTDAARDTGWEVLLEIPARAYAAIANALCPYSKAHKRRDCGSYNRMVLAKLKGWPDLAIINRRHRVTFHIEFKRQGREPEPEQIERIEQINAGGGCAFVLEPGDWDSVILPALVNGRCPVGVRDE